MSMERCGFLSGDEAYGWVCGRPPIAHHDSEHDYEPVLVVPIPESMLTMRQVSVPWCTVHDSQFMGDGWIHCLMAWADCGDDPCGPAPLTPCVVRDGVVWKTVTE